MNHCVQQCIARATQWDQIAKICQKLEWKIVKWTGHTNFDLKQLEQPETEIMWIYWHLQGKIR